METQKTHAVTGAFGYSGKYIAGRLIDQGQRVVTLTNSSHKPNPFGDKISVRPLAFDDQTRLIESLKGVSVLYNTYWIRFNYKTFGHAMAVENTLKLFSAAKEAGVQRVVHVSITNPTDALPLEYFNGKAKLERALIESGLSYAILRPAVLFGGEDILINNIAWALQTLPVFGLFGDGSYRLQPIFVDDLAKLAVEQGQSGENAIINAIGPETFTYRELVQTLGEIIGKRRPVLAMPPPVGYWAGRVIGMLMKDVFITREEITGLMADLLYVDAPSAGETRLTDWAKTNASTLGMHYAGELARRKI